MDSSKASARARRARGGVELAGLLTEALDVADVEPDALVAERGRVEQLELGLGERALHVHGGHLVADLDVAGAEVGEADAAVGDRLVDHLVEVDVARVVVVRVLGEHDAVAADALDELERAHAGGVVGEVLAVLLERGRGHHHAGAVGEHGGERDVGLLEGELHGVRAGGLGRLQRGEFGGTGRSRQIAVAQQRGDDGGRVEGGAVAELQALADGEGDGAAVGRGLRQGGGELRDDLARPVDVVELLAHSGEDRAAYEGLGERGVEFVRVRVEGDGERAAVPYGPVVGHALPADLGGRGLKGAAARRCGQHQGNCRDGNRCSAHEEIPPPGDECAGHPVDDPCVIKEYRRTYFAYSPQARGLSAWRNTFDED